MVLGVLKRLWCVFTLHRPVMWPYELGPCLCGKKTWAYLGWGKKPPSSNPTPPAPFIGPLHWVDEPAPAESWDDHG